MLQKAVWAGANSGSYQQASEALAELSETRLSLKQIRRMVLQVGETRWAERDDAVEQLKARTFPQRRAGSQACDPPAWAVNSMDGGRYQRRDHFRSDPTQEAEGKPWRETKVGCLLSMQSEMHASDPSPRFPTWLATAAVVAELAKIAEKAIVSASRSPAQEAISPRGEERLYEPPKLVSREVVASSHEAERFGWELEARAWQLGFPAAPRQAFVADGLPVNWSIAARHFPRATPILDLMHGLSYAWSAAAAVDGGGSYRQWAEWIGNGEVTLAIATLEAHQERLGMPPEDAQTSDPRWRIDRALTYYKNNQSRMNYPEYRRQGLPITSSHIESTIKQINRRVKGSEKFWRRESGDAALQLRADSLSDAKPLTQFWTRWQTQQTGSNRYRIAA